MKKLFYETYRWLAILRQTVFIFSTQVFYIFSVSYIFMWLVIVIGDNHGKCNKIPNIINFPTRQNWVGSLLLIELLIVCFYPNFIMISSRIVTKFYYKLGVLDGIFVMSCIWYSHHIYLIYTDTSQCILLMLIKYIVTKNICKYIAFPFFHCAVLCLLPFDLLYKANE